MSGRGWWFANCPLNGCIVWLPSWAAGMGKQFALSLSFRPYISLFYRRSNKIYSVKLSWVGATSSAILLLLCLTLLYFFYLTSEAVPARTSTHIPNKYPCIWLGTFPSLAVVSVLLLFTMYLSSGVVSTNRPWNGCRRSVTPFDHNYEQITIDTINKTDWERRREGGTRANRYRDYGTTTDREQVNDGRYGIREGGWEWVKGGRAMEDSRKDCTRTEDGRVKAMIVIRY